MLGNSDASSRIGCLEIAILTIASVTLTFAMDFRLDVPVSQLLLLDRTFPVHRMYLGNSVERCTHPLPSAIAYSNSSTHYLAANDYGRLLFPVLTLLKQRNKALIVVETAQLSAVINHSFYRSYAQAFNTVVFLPD